jgi:hypothetical protein
VSDLTSVACMLYNAAAWNENIGLWNKCCQRPEHVRRVCVHLSRFGMGSSQEYATLNRIQAIMRHSLWQAQDGL